jgi:hypothetical protein
MAFFAPDEKVLEGSATAIRRKLSAVLLNARTPLNIDRLAYLGSTYAAASPVSTRTWTRFS